MGQPVFTLPGTRLTIKDGCAVADGSWRSVSLACGCGAPLCVVLIPLIRSPSSAVISRAMTGVGILQPRRYVDVGTQVSGQIQRIFVQPGDVVKKGQLLAEIDPSLPRAKADADRAALTGLKFQLADQRAQLTRAAAVRSAAATGPA